MLIPSMARSWCGHDLSVRRAGGVHKYNYEAKNDISTMVLLTTKDPMSCSKMRRFPAITLLSLCVSNRPRYISGKPNYNSSMSYGEQLMCLCTCSNTRNVSRSTCYAIYLLKTTQWLWSAGGALIRRRCSQLEIAPDTSIVYISRL
ncbi:hypothetical protein CH063_14421 [Colletotrichum higginsianum]|uniref:Uncharacterized protein n=1 Tax=Colletotrichum higginsianum (strain IMI 349063) TaxID=759273 RepID=H1VYH9_COLHI|nr:hypothetical protein CH63R_14046 [Colletotrichum higginsianum IMI 349063]OBR02820.1 hypothetical protein CH63R_14046 [Colletotrichum higginsianum IMI 349063]CCF45291.1 hypothetical protein CH063_14421 [Colletotrichum higginsianum]